MLHLPVGGDLALRLDQRGGAVVDPAEHSSPTAPSTISNATIARNAARSLVCTRSGGARDEADKRVAEPDQGASTERGSRMLSLESALDVSSANRCPWR